MRSTLSGGRTQCGRSRRGGHSQGSRRLRRLSQLLLVGLLLLAATLTARALAPATPAAVAWTDFAPAGWVTALPASSQVTVQAAAGVLPDTAQYALSTDAGHSWSAWSDAGLTASGPVSTTQTLAVAGLIWPDAAIDNRIRYRIQEAGAGLAVSPAYIVPVDTVAPVSQVTQPAADAVLAAAPNIRASASDATSDVAAVHLSIQDTVSGLYWQGTDWAGGEQWLALTPDAAGWAYAGAQPGWADGVAYALRSRATDFAGLVETPAAGIRFTVDTTAPTVSLTAPADGDFWAGGRTQTITWQASDNVGLATNPITITFSGDGGATWEVIAGQQPNTGAYAWPAPPVDRDAAIIRVEAVDRAGNRGNSQRTFVLDSAAPAAPQNLTVTPATWTNVADFSATWTNPPDTSGVAGAWYKLDAPPAAADDGVFVASDQAITGIAPELDGVHQLYVWLQDRAGWADHTRAAVGVLYLDRVAPAPPGGLQGSPARTWTNINSFSEQWTNPPDLSGIVGVYYRIGRPGEFPTDGIYVPATDRLSDITVPSDGKHDLYIWLQDAAGNVSHGNRNVDPQVFWYDSQPPSSVATLTPPPAPSGWYTSTVAVTFAATDAAEGSGVEAVYSQLDSGPWELLEERNITAEGEHQLAHYARDRAGNVESTVFVAIPVDFTPPVVTLEAARPPEPTGWYVAPITLTLTADDAVSAPAVGYYQLDGGEWQTGTQIRLEESGLHQIAYYGQDGAGNRSPVQTLDAPVDTEPPATAYLLEGTLGQNNWYTSPVTVTLIATDDASGVAATYYRINGGAWQAGTQFVLDENGSYTINFYSVDAAGNVESSFPVEVKLDQNAPAAPTAVTVAPETWSRANSFTVQWANPTDLSGISGVYYRLDTEPAGPTDGELLPVTNRITGLSVSGEGAHRLYLWLSDGAGNADHRNRAVAPLLRYDATPPTTTHTVQGLAGEDGWYRSSLTVLLAAEDAHSGVARLRYRLNGGEWVTTADASVQFTLDAPGKYALQYAAEDVAGNIETVKQATLRFDPDAPPAPLDLTAGPAGWQQENAFYLAWRAPLDQSGIAGIYVRFDSPPADPTDGTFYPASELLYGLRVPDEGKHTVYAWLRDGAGNADHRTAVALPEALWYDATSPITTVGRSGASGAHGWYIGPVTFALSATDATSGLASLRYRIDGGPWQTGAAFTIDQDGAHTVGVSALDNAGNAEPEQLFAVAIDRRAPGASVSVQSHYQPTPEFEVRWQHHDPEPGSGVDRVDVQFRDGYDGAWQNWQVDTRQSAARFAGQRGHTYFFRARARDLAGHQGAWSEPAYAVVETIRNGRFDTGTFSDWETTGLLYKAVIPFDTPTGNSFVARLGTEDYGPSLDQPGRVPVGYAMIAQTVQVPPLNQVPDPTLTFRYRVLSWDVMYSPTYKRDQDTFDVWANDAAGRPLALLLRAGNPTNRYGNQLSAPYDTGWQQAFIDLTQFAGQTIQLTFANHNRYDNLYNTWSYVDDIQLQGWPYSYRYFLPLTVGHGAGPAAAAEMGAAAVDAGAAAVAAPSDDNSADPPR
ncbi:MAG: Ser-Thr-rich glycosyl-phosphatidyl-inositol-anchored membrane family protein [Chloroflexi bacterium ADurb.Bin325]|nr:MAG: Ser-Thr-rich glycosyl-phosphatidyl-inositol-anchored membrane family protein [Chloroflexi bacterium ADurb.Bin325]